jgi:hypothetical protein
VGFARVFNPHNRLSINPTHKPLVPTATQRQPPTHRCPNHVRITCGVASSKLSGGWCHHFHHAPLVFTYNSTLSMHHKLSIQQQHCLCQTHSLRTEAEHTVFAGTVFARTPSPWRLHNHSGSHAHNVYPAPVSYAAAALSHCDMRICATSAALGQASRVDDNNPGLSIGTCTGNHKAHRLRVDTRRLLRASNSRIVEAKTQLNPADCGH